MKPGNFLERRRRFVQFGLLYLGSVVVGVAAFFVILPGRRELQPSLPSTGAQTSIADERSIDSLRQQLNQARNKLTERDSLFAELQTRRSISLAPAPVSVTTKGGIADQQVLQELQRQNGIARESILQLQSEKAAMQQKLDDAQRNSDGLSNQVANLQHTNETLQAKLNEAAHGTASTDQSLAAVEDRSHGLATKNAILEKKASELADQLRFAEVDCNLSRADARQVVYNDRQRQDLLAEALSILNELVKSSDPDVQRKSKEKLARLKNIASMVHD